MAQVSLMKELIFVVSCQRASTDHWFNQKFQSCVHAMFSLSLSSISKIECVTSTNVCICIRVNIESIPKLCEVIITKNIPVFFQSHSLCTWGKLRIKVTDKYWLKHEFSFRAEETNPSNMLNLFKVCCNLWKIHDF